MSTVLSRPEGLDADRERVTRRDRRRCSSSGCSGPCATPMTTSAFYRKRFDDHGVHPDDLRSLADLAKFPFTVKQDLRDTYPFGMFAVPREQLVPHPRLVGHHRQAHRGRLHPQGHRHLGGRRRPLDPRRRRPARATWCMWPMATACSPAAWARTTAPSGSAARVVPISGGMTERQVTLIQDFEPRIIMVTPSYMLSILDEFRRQGIDPRESSLKVGIFGAEPWTNAMRQEIEAAFDMDAVDIYGLSEVMGPGVANECVETKDGLHIWEDHFYPEIIDPQTGEVLPDGEMGELVFTTLTKEGLPMIRYRTRDLTRLLPGTARSMRRMEKVTGRSDDMMILRGVNVFPTQIEEQILKCAGLAPHFQIELDARRPHGQHGRPRRGHGAGRRRGGAGGLGQGARPPHQERGRRFDEDRGARSRTASSAPRARRSVLWTTVRSNSSRREIVSVEGRPAFDVHVMNGPRGRR